MTSLKDAAEKMLTPAATREAVAQLPSSSM